MANAEPTPIEPASNDYEYEYLIIRRRRPDGMTDWTTGASLHANGYTENPDLPHRWSSWADLAEFMDFRSYLDSLLLRIGREDRAGDDGPPSVWDGGPCPGI